MSISIFLPIRKGSKRVINKNTKRFGDFEFGLLENKLNQLINVSLIDKIVISTNDELSIKVSEKYQKIAPKIHIIERPEWLAQDNTRLEDLIDYVPTIIKEEHVLWTHVTSPFITADDYDHSLKNYFQALEEGFDSLMTVLPYNSFLWDKEKKTIINKNSPLKWPRTQDLKKLYGIDSGIFINSRCNYLKMHDRVGDNPFLLAHNQYKSFDIDWEDDFILAEAIYKYFKIAGKI